MEHVYQWYKNIVDNFVPSTHMGSPLIIQMIVLKVKDILTVGVMNVATEHHIRCVVSAP